MQVTPKNSREEIRVELAEYSGQPTLNARIWWQDDSGQFHPSKKGLCLSTMHLPALANAINSTLEHTRKVGLTEEGA